MAKYVVWCLCSLLILASGCKPKGEPSSANDDPDFFMTGLVQGDPIAMTAGLNGYFMNTEIGTGLVKTFKGSLVNTSCASCSPAIEIIIRNYTILNQTTDIDSAFATGSYNYFNNNNLLDTTYLLSVTDQSSGDGNLNLLVDFGFGQISSAKKSKAKYKRSGIYSVNQFSNYPNCVSKLSQNVYLTPTRVGKHTNFNHNDIDSQLILFNSIPVSESAQVTWDFGDGKNASGSIVEHSFTLKGQYKVCMTWILNGDTAELCKNINTSNNSKCAANFDYNSTLVVDSFHFSKVTVNWIAKDGKKYSSANVTQPVESTFTVVKNSAYNQNNQGEPTRMLELNFSCLVSDGINTLMLKDMRGKFAVAYK